MGRLVARAFHGSVSLLAGFKKTMPRHRGCPPANAVSRRLNSGSDSGSTQLSLADLFQSGGSSQRVPAYSKDPNVLRGSPAATSHQCRAVVSHGNAQLTGGIFDLNLDAGGNRMSEYIDDRLAGESPGRRSLATSSCMWALTMPCNKVSCRSRAILSRSAKRSSSLACMRAATCRTQRR